MRHCIRLTLSEPNFVKYMLSISNQWLQVVFKNFLTFELNFYWVIFSFKLNGNNAYRNIYSAFIIKILYIRRSYFVSKYIHFEKPYLSTLTYIMQRRKIRSSKKTHTSHAKRSAIKPIPARN